MHPSPPYFSFCFPTIPLQVVTGVQATHLIVFVLYAKNIALPFCVGRVMSLEIEMKHKAAANLARVLALGADLKRDYEESLPYPAAFPLNQIRSVWGVQASGKNGFVIAESELPY